MNICLKRFYFLKFTNAFEKTNEIVKINESVDYRIANFLLNEIFFIINFSLEVLVIILKIVRRFCKINIAINIRKNLYNEKYTKKRKRFLKKK